MRNTRWGFTGSRKGCNESIIAKALKDLPLKKNDQIVTGACMGIDAQIAIYVGKNYPSVYQVVVVPDNRSQIDKRVFKYADWIIEMPDNSSYRDRNEGIVRLSHKVIAFWTGWKRGGTYMTINIAKREEKLHKIIYYYDGLKPNRP